MVQCNNCDKESLELQVTALTDLIEVARAVVSPLDLDTVLQVILDSAMRFADVPAGNVALFDENQQELTIHAHAGFSPDFARDVRWEVIPGGLTEEVLQTGDVLCVEDASRSSFALNPVAVKEGVQSVMCVPLAVPGSVVGLLYLCDFVPRHCRQEKLKLIPVFASFAAMAIYNARLHTRTKQMAITDALTGLHNHRYFQQLFSQELGRAKRYEKPLSIIFMDIDDFKKFNDTYGHANGDLALALIGKIVTRSLRRIDIAFRYGGEEFAVLLPETRLESALQVAERVRERIEKDTMDMLPFVAGHGITVSIGVACYPLDGSTREELFAKVDALLYKAKEGGKNMVHYFKGNTFV